MKITCISASNVAKQRNESASTRVCHIIQKTIFEKQPEIEIEIVRLLDYEFVPCRMCGDCFRGDRCFRDEAFNDVYQKTKSSDAVFVVCPHYALIPAKLVIFLEKLQEMAYLRWCANPNDKFTLNMKPVGIIVHGGQTEEALSYYQTNLLKPVANAFASVQMRVIGANSEWNQGVGFGVKRIIQPENSVFVTIEHDWAAIEHRIAPLVENVLFAIGSN